VIVVPVDVLVACGCNGPYGVESVVVEKLSATALSWQLALRDIDCDASASPRSACQYWADTETPSQSALLGRGQVAVAIARVSDVLVNCRFGDSDSALFGKPHPWLRPRPRAGPVMNATLPSTRSLTCTPHRGNGLILVDRSGKTHMIHPDCQRGDDGFNCRRCPPDRSRR
jgi:hypothetical protein